MTATPTPTPDLSNQLAPAVDPIRRALDGVDCWVVGGAVRDAMLGRPVHDLDIVVDADPETVARAVGAAVGGAPFPLSDEHGCWRVATSAAGLTQVDVCRRQGDSLEDDLRRRDFRANAIAWDPHAQQIIDPLGGAPDLDANLLRAASSHAFTDDPLRVLRLAWMAVEFGLMPDAETLRLARASAPDIVHVSGERIYEKLVQMLAGSRPRRAMRWIDDVGLTGAIIPELDACKGLEQTRFHHLDAYEHTLAVLDNAADIGQHPEHYFPGTATAPLSSEAQLALNLGALFHDLGKPLTRSEHEDGGNSFVGHEREAAEIVDRSFREWGASNDIRRKVRTLAVTHLALGFLIHRPVDARTAWQYLQRVRPVEREAICLSVADRLATVGAANKRRWQRRHVEVARYIWAEADRYDRDGIPEPLLDGMRIAEVAGIQPGPALGHLVAMLAEAQAVGSVSTVAQAEDFIRELPQGLPAAQQ